ncbi:type II toxin-antitoxin system VapB family antitoxin [Brevundimonas staleyi]|uniref:Type II toxin-antitoxin system VapB family antitoxin n=1 Tax=Brevundimonas staleyi TaxID=74326 RepID=A0ABW0FU33_9CAUL
MAFHVRDATTDALVRELALKRGLGLTEAIKLAVEAELKREANRVEEKLARMREVSDTIRAWPKTGLKADKAFFDEMSGD